MASINQQILKTLSDAAGKYVWGVDKAFAKVCNEIAHPVVVTTTDLEPPGPAILFANDAFLKLCGHELSDLIGQSPRVLHGEQTDKTKTAHFRKELAENGRARLKIVNYRSDGEAYGVDIVAQHLPASGPYKDVMLAAEVEIPVEEALS